MNMEIKTRKNKFKMSPLAIILFLALFIYAITLLGMYFWGAITSLKSVSDFRSNLYGLPRGYIWQWKWDNYIVAFKKLVVTVSVDGQRTKVTLFGMILNSVLFSGLGAFITTFTTWIFAYALAKFNYKFSKFAYSLNIVLMMIPIIGNLPSALQVWTGLGLYDTWAYVIINSISFVGGNLLIFHAFFKGIGKEFTEAAMLDGAGNYRILFSIIMPLTAQMFMILFLLAFILRWNDYMTMVIWLPSKPTLAYGIYQFGNSSDNAVSWPPLQITGCMILMIPMLILFLSCQDMLIGNIRMGALKG